MRFVFTDEAGTSGDRDETVRVVASVVAHADSQIAVAEAAIQESLMAVPREFRANFVFHAEDIMNNRRYRDRWRLTDRADLLKSIMSIPRRMGMPICFGMVHADAPATPLSRLVKPNEEQHAIAFAMSVCLADRWISDNSHQSEIATLVCENSGVNKLLQSQVIAHRISPLVLQASQIRPSKEDIERGYSKQTGVLKISRIRSTIHFVTKEEDNMVWIADACAYGVKRYFAGKDFGDDFCLAMAGRLIDKTDFVGPSSGYTIWDPRIFLRSA